MKKMLLIILTTFIFLNLYPSTVEAARGRPKIINNSLYTDTGELMRAETPRVEDTGLINNQSFWNNMRDTYKLNALRLFVRREPQTYSGGCFNECSGMVRSIQDFSTYEQYQSQILNVHKNQIRQWVNKAQQEGFYIIIDYHPLGGRNVLDAEAWWDYMAPEFANDPNVIYEITNEPGGMGEPLGNYMKNMYDRIRAVAPNTTIILFSLENYRNNTPNEMISYLDGGGKQKFNWNNALVGIHMYWSNDLDVLFNDVNQLKQRVPVVNTEVGSTWAPDHTLLIPYLENYKIAWFSLDGFTANRYDAPFTWPKDSYFGGGGGGTNPTPTVTVSPTVTPSPTVTVTPTPTPTPSTGSGETFNIPSKIEAEDFTSVIGTENVNFRFTSTSDGEPTSSKTGTKIGYTTQGLQLNYIVNAPAVGNYNITLRVASADNASGKTLTVKAGGVDYTVNIPPTTGGWETFADFTVSNVPLPAGQSTISVLWNRSTMDLNYLVVSESGGTNPTPTLTPTVTPTVTPNFDSKYDVNEDGQINLKDVIDVIKFIFLT